MYYIDLVVDLVVVGRRLYCNGINSRQATVDQSYLPAVCTALTVHCSGPRGDSSRMSLPFRGSAFRKHTNRQANLKARAVLIPTGEFHIYRMPPARMRAPATPRRRRRWASERDADLVAGHAAPPPVGGHPSEQHVSRVALVSSLLEAKRKVAAVAMGTAVAETERSRPRANAESRWTR